MAFLGCLGLSQAIQAIWIVPGLSLVYPWIIPGLSLDHTWNISKLTHYIPWIILCLPSFDYSYPYIISGFSLNCHRLFWDYPSVIPDIPLDYP